jgi:atypical dual specificity phosphatase
MLIELPFALPGKIFRSPMPFSRFDNQNLWSSFQEQEIGFVVVLTEQQEYLVYAGKDLPAFYRSHGLEALQIPVPDFGIPQDLEAWKQGLDAALSAARDGKNVAVHCLAGIGRTGTFMACLARETLGMAGRQAISWVRESVPGAMESPLQEDFVIKYDF